MPGISSRETYQQLRDAALGVAPLQVLAQMPGGIWQVHIGGWQLVLLIDDEGLASCTEATRPDGCQASQADWPRYGTNPVDHLSLWERRQIERALTGQGLLDEI
ncbi:MULTISPECIES: DUF7693 family protein [Pseudomonas]|jgi:hypothetical protein|uniref:DUF7693 domain-containing protein n=1 Tax=Pseudomonas mosselii TaxID=78327 RepID=A0A5R8ZI77_9PSED|nr:hypothetical protein [Pseudomonas mosselii]TLP65469.1 hypothetical protein FEM01_04620 [Pseudomonas mosselii]